MITIIIPVYNGEKLIGRAIESVLRQNGDWELIIVDDHSIDGTRCILSQYASQSRISVLESPDKGVTQARIYGAQKAKGDYLFFMDADDEIAPDVIMKMQKIISESPSIDMVISDIKEIKEEKKDTYAYGDKNFINGQQLFNWIIDHRTGYLWGKAIRRELFLTLPYVPLQLKFCEDYVQMLQLSVLSSDIRHTGTIGYNYYQNSDSVCNTIKSRSEYAEQFYRLADALKQLATLNIFNSRETGLYANIRLKVMFLYYARLYLAVKGGVGG